MVGALDGNGPHAAANDANRTLPVWPFNVMKLYWLEYAMNLLLSAGLIVAIRVPTSPFVFDPYSLAT